MATFEVKSDRREALETITHPGVRLLLDYWLERRGARSMPSRADVDPIDLRDLLGRMHLLDVLGPRQFRYRVYGSRITNPDVRDMTGRTTMDYDDKAFAELVTTHLQECVDERAPVYRHIVGQLQDAPYEYYRLTLPLSADDRSVDMLIAAPVRISVPVGLPKRTLWDL